MPHARAHLSLPLLVLGTGLFALSAVVALGPLNPPSGAVTSTNKVLAEIEPRTAVSATNTPGTSSCFFRISQSGSYYLTANVIGVAGKNGIEIAASGVTLDLNGFEVLGAPAGGAFDGIRTTIGNLKDITVRNGTVRNWGDDGIELINTTGAAGAVVENVQANGNAGSGIVVSLSGGMALNCTATENGQTGISGGRLIRGCVATDNAGVGLAVGQGGTILNSTSFSNDGDGISVGFGCTVSNCTSDNNTGDGIEASNGTTITDCSFMFNSGSGINIFSNITVRNCTAASNTLYGIDADTSCHIEGCTANSNTLEGIRVGSRGIVRNNIANSNAPGTEIGAGIHGIGSDTRFEGNVCNNNDFGIDIDGTGNIIIANTCANNTQAFVFAADNFYGPIIDRRIPATVASTPAVAGFSAVSTMGSTDPRANFAQ